jgi:hypothetical protein
VIICAYQSGESGTSDALPPACRADLLAVAAALDAQGE